jgi:hypothetical protein
MVDYDKLKRPGSGKAPRQLDDVEREIVRADMAELIAREKENGDWAKWEESQKNWKGVNYYYSDVRIVSNPPSDWPPVIEPYLMIEVTITSDHVAHHLPSVGNHISREFWFQCVGRSPDRDDLERANCRLAGELGHMSCGWCDICRKPRWMCRPHGG